jgi:hypothetical protein
MMYYAIIVKGRHKIWSFPVQIDPKYLDDYRGDGLIIDEVVNVIPERVQRWGLTRVWCWLQDRGIL